MHCTLVLWNEEVIENYRKSWQFWEEQLKYISAESVKDPIKTTIFTKQICINTASTFKWINFELSTLAVQSSHLNKKRLHALPVWKLRCVHMCVCGNMGQKFFPTSLIYYTARRIRHGFALRKSTICPSAYLK